MILIYLMQLSGSFTQSVLHRNLSHESQPIGGVLASPLSRQLHKVLLNKMIQTIYNIVF